MAPLPIVQDFEAFAAERGASRHGFGEAGLHNPAAHMPKSTWNRLLKRQHNKDVALAQKREKLRGEYEAAVERGEVRPPTSLERLQIRAAGDENNPSTIAARNILAKRKALPSSNQEQAA